MRTAFTGLTSSAGSRICRDAINPAPPPASQITGRQKCRGTLPLVSTDMPMYPRRRSSASRRLWILAAILSVVSAGTAAMTWSGFDLPDAVNLENADQVSSVVSAILAAIAAGGAWWQSAAARRSRGAQDTEPAEALIWDIPPPVRTFVHRDGDIRLIDAAMRRLGEAGMRAVVALVGPPGIGKSQLAAAYAHQHGDDAVIAWRVDASTEESLRFGLARLAEQLGIEETDDAKAASRAVAMLSGRRRWLLLFDNAGGPDVLRPFIPKRGGRALVTSRNPAWDSAAEAIELAPFGQREAAQFLMTRANDPNGRPAATTLAREMAGLPLALEQVGAYCRTVGISLGRYLERYRRELLLGEGAPGDYASGAVTATVALAVELAIERHPAAGALLMVYSFVAPVAIPRDLPLLKPEILPQELAQATRNSKDFDELVKILLETSLIAIDGPETLRVHQLVQRIIRNQAYLRPVGAPAPDPEQAEARTAVERGNEVLRWGLVVGDLVATGLRYGLEVLDSRHGPRHQRVDVRSIMSLMAALTFQLMHQSEIMADQHGYMADLHQHEIESQAN
ncbi:NB-ARC domain-containing protein [Actinoplanes sp. NPDC049118]|uniref:NB-ARC domain-containing protein n=1 Tax=Actinoplanes sp. NPDC049118 TaxID=3155769 RepID=UPI0033C6C468